MNDCSPAMVRIVVDRAFGERLASLPLENPVWIVDSDFNQPFVQLLRSERSEDYLHGITTFSGNPEENPAGDLLNMLGTIDEHHNQHASNPPYSLLEVIGCQPFERVLTALAELGFQILSSTLEGFIASNQPAKD